MTKNVYSRARLHFSFEFEAKRRVRKSSRNIEDNLGANMMSVTFVMHLDYI